MSPAELFAEEQPPSRLLLIFVALLCGFFGIALYLAGQVSSAVYTHNESPAAGFAIDRTFVSDSVAFREVSTKSPRMNIRVIHPEPHSNDKLANTLTVDQLLTAIRVYKIAGELSPLVPGAALKYLSAHFDSRRARSEDQFEWEDQTGSYHFQHLRGKNSRPLALGIHQNASDYHLILVSSAEDKVHEPTVQSALHVLLTDTASQAGAPPVPAGP